MLFVILLLHFASATTPGLGCAVNLTLTADRGVEFRDAIGAAAVAWYQQSSHDVRVPRVKSYGVHEVRHTSRVAGCAVVELLVEQGELKGSTFIAVRFDSDLITSFKIVARDDVPPFGDTDLSARAENLAMAAYQSQNWRKVRSLTAETLEYTGSGEVVAEVVVRAKDGSGTVERFYTVILDEHAAPVVTESCRGRYTNKMLEAEFLALLHAPKPPSYVSITRKSVDTWRVVHGFGNFDTHSTLLMLDEHGKFVLRRDQY